MARARSLAGLAPARQLVATSRGLIEDHAERNNRPDSVRAMTITLLKIEAMTEAALHGYGGLISHTVIDGDTVQCVFERGMVTRSAG